MNRVVISGFYGFHNIGDEAILLSLTNQLKKINPDVHITVLSNSPDETMEKFKVSAVDRSDFFKVTKAIFKTDVLISGGGSLLQDITSARSIHYYLSIINMGIMFGKKVFLISHGIGPLIRESNMKRVKRALNKVSNITVRDVKSYELLTKIGVKPNKIQVTTDPVIALDMQDRGRGSEILENLNIVDKERKNIAIAIRQKDFRVADRSEKLVNLANRLSEKYNVIFVPFYYKNDTKIYNDIHHLTPENVYYLLEKYSSTEFLSIIKNMDILVGSRLHSLIFSLVSEVPFIGVSYDPKIENFMETIDMQPVCSMEDFSPEKIEKEILRYENEYDLIKDQIVKSKYKLKALLEINDSILKMLIM